MVMKAELHIDINKVDKLLIALESIIPFDTYKDMQIHMKAIKDLKDYKESVRIIYG
jgi:L-fucose mutarotase/ribose pyranase (RbsD/FucU family)